MGDARAEHAPGGLVDPAVARGTLSAHVVNAKGARDCRTGACNRLVATDRATEKGRINHGTAARAC